MFSEHYVTNVNCHISLISVSRRNEKHNPLGKLCVARDVTVSFTKYTVFAEENSGYIACKFR